MNETHNEAHSETHPELETLSAYADGELDVADVARVERHLSSCAACRDQLRRLRELVHAAAALPRDIEPPAEVWADLRHRMAPRRVPARHRRATRNAGWLAAAAVLLVAGVVLLRSGAGRAGGAGGRRDADGTARVTVATPLALASVDRNYAGTIAQLRRTLDTQRGTLSPATVRVLEHSVAVIDTAIAEARAALAADPGNDALVEILAAQYEVKVDLMQRATKLSPSL